MAAFCTGKVILCTPFQQGIQNNCGRCCSLYKTSIWKKICILEINFLNHKKPCTSQVSLMSVKIYLFYCIIFQFISTKYCPKLGCPNIYTTHLITVKQVSQLIYYSYMNSFQWGLVHKYIVFYRILPKVNDMTTNCGFVATIRVDTDSLFSIIFRLYALFRTQVRIIRNCSAAIE